MDDNFRAMRSFPLFKMRDTPLRSLYRLRDCVCANHPNYTMLEGECFFGRWDWPVKDIPDPNDPDPVRYAVLAGIVETMVREWNYKIKLGIRRKQRFLSRKEIERARDMEDWPLEEAPSWTAHVPPAHKWVSFVRMGQLLFHDRTSGPFGSRRTTADASQLGNM